MEILLLLIYSFFVWLIFIKFKLLPWNIVSQVIVITIPIFAIALLILVLNIVAPSSPDVRVINYVVQIVPQVRGRVIEVPIEPNEPLTKGQVLFRIDSDRYAADVRALEAKIPELRARLAAAQAHERELEDKLKSFASQKRAVQPRLELARIRESQNNVLFREGVVPKIDHLQTVSNLRNLEAELATADSNESQVVQQLSAQTDTGEFADIAEARAALEQNQAQLEEARWWVRESVVRAPTNGRVVNLQLREGSYSTALPLAPVMTFVEDEQWLIALFTQNELRYIEPGDEAEVALRTYPNRIIKCKVDSIIWASGQGQLPIGGAIPETGAAPVPEGRFSVRLRPVGKDAKLFLAAGARGHGAVYTKHGVMIQIVRKVILRVGTKLDWLVLKLH
jgi:multidrug resistance efflux pump